MLRKLLIIVAAATLPIIVQADDYLGNLSANPHAPNSTANPYGAGSPYAPDSPSNPFGKGLRIIGDD